MNIRNTDKHEAVYVSDARRWVQPGEEVTVPDALGKQLVKSQVFEEVSKKSPQKTADEAKKEGSN